MLTLRSSICNLIARSRFPAYPADLGFGEIAANATAEGGDINAIAVALEVSVSELCRRNGLNILMRELVAWASMACFARP